MSYKRDFTFCCKRKVKEAARKIRQSVHETFTYYDFPREHRMRIRTNNALERIMREIRRPGFDSGRQTIR
jgi:transposase-like protein